ncbi:MAG: hypothetical protein J3R72DRAFT_441663 [Linnemannia gamsii]|nr:MAG: hypothetical protein J3R72DRAFT_441663 [Linnemannia gamsii]
MQTCQYNPIWPQNPQDDQLIMEASFQSLVERSIKALSTINFVGEYRDREETINLRISRLRSLRSIDDVLKSCEYWFFQRRDYFMSQSCFPKWSAASFDGYILISVDIGFTNNKDCLFVSHFWRTRSDPDPEGVDLSLFQDDQRGLEWSYIWVDWTCLPQAPRTYAEDSYFQTMLRRIPSLVQDCGFSWRFPAFEPRAWVLYEVATFRLNHSFPGKFPDDIQPFLLHVQEMVEKGVTPTLKKYGYRCTNQSDLQLVTGWLEILVILFNNVQGETSHHRASIRQNIMRDLYKPSSVVNYLFHEVYIDKEVGTITMDGITHTFNPIPRLPNKRVS